MHFLRVLKSFKIKFKETWNSDETCTLDFYGLPSSLDIMLLKLEYDEIIGYDITYNTDTKTKIQTPITRTVRVFTPFGSRGGRYLRCVLDKETFANKINLIEPALRTYHKNHPTNGILRLTP